MTQEEKAKAYDEAFKEASVAHKDEDRHLKATLERIFPELKESEDERIRKALISFLKSPFVNENITDEKVTPWIAWLEKQGEQKPADKVEPKFHEGDIIKPKDGGHEPWQIMQVDMFDKKYRFKDGYVIHFSQEDNYELVEQKSTWSEEDKNMLKWVIGYLNNKMLNTPIAEERTACKNAIIWLEKQAEQKPAWSEEDEAKLKSILFHIEDVENKDVIDWFKSLKGRVQPKQEWSEEDIVAIDCAVEVLSKDLPSLAASIERLKSLRPQKHWKPSDAQMASITCAVRKMKESACYDSELVSLLNDLKKLKG